MNFFTNTIIKLLYYYYYNIPLVVVGHLCEQKYAMLFIWRTWRD